MQESMSTKGHNGTSMQQTAHCRGRSVTVDKVELVLREDRTTESIVQAYARKLDHKVAARDRHLLE